METKKLSKEEVEKLSLMVSSDIGGASLLDRIADVGQMAAVAIMLSIAAIIMSFVALAFN